jgi:cell division protein FtsI (penicillin-binding protein 3)
MKNNFGHSWRANLIYIFLAISLFILVFRIVSLKYIEGDFLTSKGKSMLETSRSIPAIRGSILDRNNFPLAVSINQYDLYALKQFSEEDFNKLKNILFFKKDFLGIKKLNKKTLIFSNLNFSQYENVKSLNLSGIEIESFQKRYYPLGEQVSTLIGFAGKDGFGLEGLENILDSELSGVSGQEIIFRNASRRPRVTQEVIQGLDIKLTIDSRVQFYAYKHLSSFVEANNAKGGSAIVLDNISGEILAIASYPSYNPNSPKRQIKRNRALVDAFEPGSIIKPLALAKGIDMGVFTNNQVIDTSPGFINLSGRTVSDLKNYHNLTVSEIIAKSSQVGASKLALQVGIDGLISGYKGFGLSKPPNIFFPGIAYGVINSRENISDHEIASIGFGYSMTASSLQLAQAYSVFANEGYLKDFKIFINDVEVYKQRVIGEDTAVDVLESLKLVVSDGTGSLARISNHDVAGKTGTSHKASSKGGYDQSKYIASFAGIAPLTSKRLTIFVSIDEPGLNNYSGGSVAAPLFAAISSDVLNYLDE